MARRHKHQPQDSLERPDGARPSEPGPVSPLRVVIPNFPGSRSRREGGAPPLDVSSTSKPRLARFIYWVALRDPEMETGLTLYLRSFELLSVRRTSRGGPLFRECRRVVRATASELRSSGRPVLCQD